MQKDSAAYTIAVATVLCLVCSVVVAGAAVSLKERQDLNKEIKRQKNVLIAAGLFDPAKDDVSTVTDIYADRVAEVVVDLASGTVDAADPATFDPAKQEEQVDITGQIGIAERGADAFAFLVRSEADPSQFSQVVLPVYGKGLWSTLEGYMALENDVKTIAGLTFYAHGETPGLGGEVDNPKWKAQWVGKLAYDESGKPSVAVVKGGYNREAPTAVHSVDGMSGATITSNGVENLINYWISADAFGPFLDNLRAGKIAVPGSAAPDATDAESTDADAAEPAAETTEEEAAAESGSALETE